jgi:hypothetical protein
MKTLTSYLVLSFLFYSGLKAQHLIGFQKPEVSGIVKREMKGFNLDNSSVNPVFNYLKFINTAGTKTLLVFFDENDRSTGVRLVSDYSEFSFMKADFDKQYKKVGKESWEYKVGSESFNVTIEEKEWYFVVHTKKKTK